YEFILVTDNHNEPLFENSTSNHLCFITIIVTTNRKEEVKPAIIIAYSKSQNSITTAFAPQSNNIDVEILIHSLSEKLDLTAAQEKPISAIVTNIVATIVE